MKRRLPIAVVIPVYQGRHHVPGAIASVRAQTIDVDEIIVVDDGSSDGGAETARALGVTVLRQENAGCGPARNRGIAHARSPWIALLDADDRWEPEKLERQWRARDGDPAVRLLSSDCATFVDDTRMIQSSSLAGTWTYARVPKTRLAPGTVEVSAAALAAWLPRGQFLVASALLLERSLVIDDGIAFAALPAGPISHIAEDIEWYLRAVRRTDVIVVEAPLVRYAVGAPSLSSSAGRIHYGLVRLGEMIALAPDRYVARAGVAFARDRVRRETLAIAAFLRALDFERARATIADVRRHRRSLDLVVLASILRVARQPSVARILRRIRERWRARSRCARNR